MRAVRALTSLLKARWRALKAKVRNWLTQARAVAANCVDQLANDPGYVEAVRHVIGAGTSLLSGNPRVAYIGDQLTTATVALLRITGNAEHPAPPPPVWD